MSRLRRRKRSDDEGKISESWLIPYADILTLLLALFIVLFASSSIDAEKYQGVMESFQQELAGSGAVGMKNQTGGGITGTGSGLGLGYRTTPKIIAKAPLAKEPQIHVDPELAAISKELEEYIKSKALNGVVSLQGTKRGVEVTVQEIVLFDSGKADLKPDSYKTLQGLLVIMKKLDNPIVVEGHTDNVPMNSPRFPSNWELSVARSASVVHFFVANGIPPTQLQISGFGEFRPLKPNDTPENRQANRRVTIAILKKDDSTTTTTTTTDVTDTTKETDATKKTDTTKEKLTDTSKETDTTKETDSSEKE